MNPSAVGLGVDGQRPLGIKFSPVMDIIDDTCTSAKTEAPKTHAVVFQAVLD